MNLPKAIALANEAHASDTRRDGTPYILHPLRVMIKSRPEDQVCAVLHDVLEDHPEYERRVTSVATHQQLKTLTRLTHFKTVTYKDYIANLCHDPAAMRIKLLDIDDNFMTARPEKLELYVWAGRYIRKALELLAMRES